MLRHDDALEALDDPVTYPNAVSRHLSVPNGMDPPEHTAFRSIVDRYYTPERMDAFEPACRGIIAELIDELPRGSEAEFMSEFAEPFANRLHSAFMGWPDRLRGPLRESTKKNHRATLATDRLAMSAVAKEFDSYIREQLDERRAAGQDARDDVTTALLTETTDGRAVTDEEIVSIVRNWTVGELGTIASGVGIVGGYLAEHPGVQSLLRADPSLAERASDEILRIHPPLIVNRRRTSRPVTLGGRDIPSGCSWCGPRPIATRKPSAIPTRSVSTATPNSTCCTAGASTTAPGRRWRGSSFGCSSRSSWPRRRGSNRASTPLR